MKKSKLTVVVDSQEVAHGKAWKFPRTVSNTVVRSLQRHGADYTVQGYTGIIAVERKSWPDWVASVSTDWPRFKRSLKRMRKSRYRAIIIEGALTDMILYSAIPKTFIMHRTAEIMARGFQVLYASDKDKAQQMCWMFFQASIKRIRHNVERADI